MTTTGDAVAACVYCGLSAGTVDHVPPTSIRERLPEIGIRVRSFTVACCRECNSALGSRGGWTIHERRQYVRVWIAKRYRKYLVMPEWSSADLGALDPRLREDVERALRVKALTLKRLRWRGGVVKIRTRKNAEPRPASARVIKPRAQRVAKPYREPKHQAPASIVSCAHCGTSRAVQRRRAAQAQSFCSPRCCTAWHRAQRASRLLSLAAQIQPADAKSREALADLVSELSR